ncbi:MAG TPA: hypothetical protein VF596_09730 [Pyrinomonadaceae bacterium]|jgi:hypothetical protein
MQILCVVNFAFAKKARKGFVFLRDIFLDLVLKIAQLDFLAERIG